MKIALFDPATLSRNLGDTIISTAIERELNIAEISISQRLSTHAYLSNDDLETLKYFDYFLIGGSNLLTSRILGKHQRPWKLNLQTIHALKNKCIFFGVGWWQYQGELTRAKAHLYKYLMAKDFYHSVRDEYSKSKLNKLGLKVLNTSCPTLWPNHLQEKTTRENTDHSVVLTLTDYNQHEHYDRRLIDVLKNSYDVIYLWPQAYGDISYAKSLSIDIKILLPTIEALEHQLKQGSHYVGTRLHGGIFALMSGSRTTIISIDNRAAEISRDTGLKVIDRRRVFEFEKIHAEHQRINLPTTSIELFRNQLKCLAV